MKSLKQNHPTEYAYLEPDLAGSLTLVVAPERARVPLEVVVTHQSYSEAASELRRARGEVAALLGEGASLETEDYTPPSSSDGTSYRGALRLTISVDLAGLGDVDSRMARIDAALGRLFERIHREAPLRKKWTSKTAASMSHGLLSIEVADPGAHRPALLKLVDARLDGLSEGSNSPQWRPTDLRGVSNGEVRVRRATLAGVTLELHLAFALRTGD